MQFHIIDDDQGITSTLVTMLKLLGHEARPFNNPTQYLDQMKQPEYTKPTAIMTDIDMPSMNGFELVRHVLNIDPEMQYILMTGNQDLKHPLIDTASMYLCKPITMKMLEMATHTIREA